MATSASDADRRASGRSVVERRDRPLAQQRRQSAQGVSFSHALADHVVGLLAPRPVVSRDDLPAVQVVEELRPVHAPALRELVHAELATDPQLVPENPREGEDCGFP